MGLPAYGCWSCEYVIVPQQALEDMGYRRSLDTHKYKLRVVSQDTYGRCCRFISGKRQRIRARYGLSSGHFGLLSCVALRPCQANSPPNEAAGAC